MITLTPTEQLVADCLPDGLSNKEIERRLKMREATVKVHLRAINEKLGTRNRTQIAVYVDRQKADRHPGAEAAE
jgi:two-component system nitrate/nitrite response regulator NarL